MFIDPKIFYNEPDTIARRLKMQRLAKTQKERNIPMSVRYQQNPEIRAKRAELAKKVGTGVAVAYGTALGLKEGIRYVDPVSKTLLNRAALKSIQIPDFYSNVDYDPETMLGRITKKAFGSKVARATEHFSDVFLPGDVEKKDIETLLKGGSKNVSYSGYLKSVFGIENEKQLRRFMRKTGIRTAPELMREIELEAKIARANLPRKFKERIDRVKRDGKNVFRLKKAGISTELDRYGFIPHKTSAQRAISHERLLGRMGQVITASNIKDLNKSDVTLRGVKMTFAEAMKKDGLSKVIETDYKTLFKGHEGAISNIGWNPTSPHNKITASLITGANNDKRAIVTAGKKDILYKATENAMGATGKNPSVKQIDDAVEKYFRGLKDVEFKKLHTDHTTMLLKNKKQLDVLNKKPSVYQTTTGPITRKIDIGENAQRVAREKNTLIKLTKEETIQNLINKYKKSRQIFFDDNGVFKNVNLNFSAANKPHFLSGGMNYSVNFFKGDKEITVKGIKIKNRFKIFHDMLISDDFDMYRGIKPLQKNVHFNIAHSTNVNTQYGKKVLQDLIGFNFQKDNIDNFSRKKTTDLFKLAMRNKDYRAAVRLARRLFGKAAMKAIRIALFKGR